MAVSLLEDENGLQIVLRGLMNLHINLSGAAGASPGDARCSCLFPARYDENSITIAPYAGRSKARYWSL